MRLQSILIHRSIHKLVIAAILIPFPVYAAQILPSELPQWLALAPPLVAIVLALALREVISSLLLGIYVGAVLLNPTSPGAALLSLPTEFLPTALADRGHASIVLFSLMLAGMVGVLSESGGMSAIVEGLKKLTRTRRGGMITAWAMGLIIFFDDYANTLLVGNTLRPFTDRLRISRAKLAYIVDSTAAPVASIAIISTWVGFEVGLLGDAAQNINGFDHDPYMLFLKSIPYSMYSFTALILVFAVVWWQRDMTLMHQVELGALEKDDASREKGVDENREHSPAGRYALIIAFAPILSVVASTFIGLYISGRMQLDQEATFAQILGAADSYAVLLSASFIGLLLSMLLATTLGKKPVSDVSDSVINGIRAMMPAMVILILAWSLGDVSEQVGTAQYIIDGVSGKLPAFLLPTALFLVSALVAFSTGTSWGAMAILIPIALPLAVEFSAVTIPSAPASYELLFGSIAAVLSGATFGDHCSPISDTTILSSMASGCKHIVHVRTQIPYALFAGTIAILLGYLPAGFGISPVFTLLPALLIVFFGPKLLPVLFKS